MPDMERVKLATPYYGYIARAGVGFEKVYLCAWANSKTGETGKPWIEIWNGISANELSLWLTQKGVDWLFTNDFSLALEKSLSGKDIQVCWNVPGDMNSFDGYALQCRA